MTSLPPCVAMATFSFERLRGCRLAARLSIGCVGTSAGGRTGCVAPPLAAPRFRPRELSWTLWLSAGNCRAPPSHSADPFTAAPRAVTHDPRPSTPFGSARAPQAQPGRRDGRMSGGRRKEEPSQPQLANGALKVSVWSKVLRSDAAWEDKVRWGLARAQVRGAGWHSGTQGQARACPGAAESWGVRANSAGAGLRAELGAHSAVT